MMTIERFSVNFILHYLHHFFSVYFLNLFMTFSLSSIFFLINLPTSSAIYRRAVLNEEEF